MAKKKKKSTTRRRHRVGAMSLNPGSDLVKFGSIAAGFLLGNKINAQLDKIVPPDKVDAKLVGAGQMGLGAAYLFIKKGKKNLPLTIVSGVMAGAGLKRTLTAFGLGSLGGYSSVPTIGGYQNVNVVNGKRRLAGNGSNFNPLPGGMGLNGSKFQRVYTAMNGGSEITDR